MNDSEMGRRELLKATAAAAILGALLPVRSAHAAQLSEAEAANLKVVTDFCASWSTRDLAKVTSQMTDDSVYRMTETTPPMTGHAPLIAQMQPWVDTSDSIEFKILESFAKGPIVITHRIDRFASKTRPLTWEGVGVFFVQNGKIKEWSDYTIRVERA
jgi:limonene-1,2-epoxide hydrolase